MFDGYIARRLSAKLLMMTIGFVMLAELVIFIPSAALYRQNRLLERIEQAGILNQALTSVPDYEATEVLSGDFMRQTDIELLATKQDGMTSLLLGMPPNTVNYIEVDMRHPKRLPLFRDTFGDFFATGEDRLRVIANSPVEGQEKMELIIPRQAMRAELWEYSERIFLLSLAIAIITGAFIYFAMVMVIVRPLQQLLRGMQAFRENPQRRQNIGRSNHRKDELGELEREFYDLKQSLRSAFRQRERLAGLGLSVAKINHDLRNVLSTALLVSDRLTTHKDEKVVDMGEKLVRTVERGVGLTEEVLAYSRADTADPDVEPIRISFLLGEVAGDTMAQYPSLHFKNKVPSDLQIIADPDQTYRILHNLFRNAAQAMAGRPTSRIHVSSEETDEVVYIDIVDNGPGLPERAEKNLFLAFAASRGEAGSTGLGLSISKELAIAQNGDLTLVRTDSTGTHFRLCLPSINA
ncbi:signal transduction histidine kinase /histidine kinase [Litorimonas taeanensis]|uniref:histidine kinase n=1 Tax=Litorimonas taeanensis TaxID=568099 RepID=A0A420WE07_9PROT|nr:HAMP domain-containing sensor histidine kinase [Litorimonas taeanensis]RKQ69233.1 signal transduction histidine kinase /histidine kinase [Litorimonas taeanensis]